MMEENLELLLILNTAGRTWLIDPIDLNRICTLASVGFDTVSTADVVLAGNLDSIMLWLRVIFVFWGSFLIVLSSSSDSESDPLAVSPVSSAMDCGTLVAPTLM
ncbi:hypothetical protein OGAPHI_004708 [Ogataea philodendri]|uniref:Uncharacterized protein n=1 Tax=Ogataea philodendri TaxID=1378263 RepID=A0A9P8T3A8_9ASCO|nr:uncharacterized protein OGAPHI_004708 [Ogataea philodendri]KAH3663994.1 hypothetical protein OGAPHI_004708 [Ogataea philodendri]